MEIYTIIVTYFISIFVYLIRWFSTKLNKIFIYFKENVYLFNF